MDKLYNLALDSKEAISFKCGVFAWSDMTEEIENSKNINFNRLRALAIILISLSFTIIPSFVSKMFYNEHGICENLFLTELVFPSLSLIFMLLAVILLKKTHIAETLDFIWYRWERSEIVKAILLIITIPIIYSITAVLVQMLGLQFQREFKYYSGQQSLAFFVSLTVLTAILFPVIEEIFWRGSIQVVFERIIGKFPALLGQAVLFAAIHFRPLGGFIQVFVLGLLAGFWRWRRRTLLPIIIAHIAINSLWCAVRWRDWIDCTRIKITNDYLAEYKEFVGADKLDPNDNARYFYEKTRQSVVNVPPEWSKVKDIWPAHWLPEQKVAISSWLLDNEKAVYYISQGSQKPYYWPEFKGSILMAAMPDIAWVRHAAFTLYIQSQINAADGNIERACSELITCLRFTDHFAGRKPSISQIVSFYMRATVMNGVRMILSNVDVLPPMLEQLQKAIEQSLTGGTYFSDFTVEKFLLLDFIQNSFTYDGNGGGYITEISLRTPGSLQFLPKFTESKKKALLKLDRRGTTNSVNLLSSHLALAAKMTAWRYQNDSNLKKQLELITQQNAFISVFWPSYNTWRIQLPSATESNPVLLSS
ncbi:MAG: CPBP family intramembrane metalloprotease, partial [Planctomycetes bacterium]|nr:CPBP family intramembrane metalloprotease [Planctomycetota bacterium]MBL7143765.1 CPBP family intramembrane metalloprotease [Phycisphaerae bacterium]